MFPDFPYYPKLRLKRVGHDFKLSQIIDTYNYNFDQLYLHGGVEGQPGLRGERGYPGASLQGIQGMQGIRGSRTWFEGGVIVDGSLITNPNYQDGDVIIDNTGKYYQATLIGNNLYYSLVLDLPALSSNNYFTDEQSYFAAFTGTFDEHLIYGFYDPPVTHSPSRIILADKLFLNGASYANYYRRVFLGMHESNDAVLSTATLSNILGLKDVLGVPVDAIDPSSPEFTQLNLKYRKNYTTAPSLNSFKFKYWEDATGALKTGSISNALNIISFYEDDNDNNNNKVVYGSKRHRLADYYNDLLAITDYQDTVIAVNRVIETASQDKTIKSDGINSKYLNQYEDVRHEGITKVGKFSYDGQNNGLGLHQIVELGSTGILDLTGINNTLIMVKRNSSNGYFQIKRIIGVKNTQVIKLSGYNGLSAADNRGILIKTGNYFGITNINLSGELPAQGIGVAYKWLNQRESITLVFTELLPGVVEFLVELENSKDDRKITPFRYTDLSNYNNISAVFPSGVYVFEKVDANIPSNGSPDMLTTNLQVVYDEIITDSFSAYGSANLFCIHKQHIVNKTGDVTTWVRKQYILNNTTGALVWSGWVKEVYAQQNTAFTGNNTFAGTSIFNGDVTTNNLMTIADGAKLRKKQLAVTQIFFIGLIDVWSFAGDTSTAGLITGSGQNATYTLDTFGFRDQYLEIICDIVTQLFELKISMPFTTNDVGRYLWISATMRADSDTKITFWDHNGNQIYNVNQNAENQIQCIYFGYPLIHTSLWFCTIDGWKQLWASTSLEGASNRVLNNLTVQDF
jgi:hypothetical protein